MLLGNNSTITNAITHTDNCATNNNKHITILWHYTVSVLSKSIYQKLILTMTALKSTKKIEEHVRYIVLFL